MMATIKEAESKREEVTEGDSENIGYQGGGMGATVNPRFRVIRVQSRFIQEGHRDTVSRKDGTNAGKRGAKRMMPVAAFLALDADPDTKDIQFGLMIFVFFISFQPLVKL